MITTPEEYGLDPKNAEAVEQEAEELVAACAKVMEGSTPVAAGIASATLAAMFIDGHLIHLRPGAYTLMGRMIENQLRVREEERVRTTGSPE
jgi:molybdopterin-biosynthesis enzyme MoeA-like protein